MYCWELNIFCWQLSCSALFCPIFCGNASSMLLLAQPQQHNLSISQHYTFNLSFSTNDDIITVYKRSSQWTCFLFMILDHNIQFGRTSFTLLKNIKNLKALYISLLLHKTRVYNVPVTTSSVSSWYTGQSKHQCS
jgi:hypothetical protein